MSAVFQKLRFPNFDRPDLERHAGATTGRCRYLIR
jgi:hypothetical protein